MLFFGKKAKDEAPAPSKPVANPAPIPPAKPVDPNDFFADIDKRAAAARRAEPKRPDLVSPEITGLREAPAAPPPIRINNIAGDEAAAEALADKTIPDPSIKYGDISVISEDIDTDSLPMYGEKKTDAPKKFETEGKLSAEDFFGDLDKRAAAARRAEPKRPDLVSPEITGLREAPEAAPPSSINNIVGDEAAAEALADKTIPDPSVKYGDINDIDISKIDTGVLRAEKE
ncbi:MAG: hypothetical protein ACI4Q6_06160 [Huintestinicola sp.]